MLGHASLDLKLLLDDIQKKPQKNWKDESQVKLGKWQKIRLLAPANHSELSDVSLRMEQLSETSK